MSAEPRERMVIEQLQRRGVADARVLDAFRRVPREVFLDGDRTNAYADGPLDIGHGQTISQPYVVAITAAALELRGPERVLEIGTGSGYAAAILGQLAAEVHTVERIPELARAATAHLAPYQNVHVHHADGTLGWPANAPYDAIAVAACAPKAPPSLLAQLAIGGRLVLPIGDPYRQHLVRIERRDEDVFVDDDLGEVRFVPLVGAEGWPA